MAHRPAGSMSSPFRHDAAATPRDLLHATPRTGGVSFSSDIHARDYDPDVSHGVHTMKSVVEMNTLRCRPPRHMPASTLTCAMVRAMLPGGSRLHGQDDGGA